VGHFAITAVGGDRPGIVAAVTEVFVELGCNLEDSSMTILRGQFAMMLVVAAPAGVGVAELQAALQRPAHALELVVSVRPAESSPSDDDPGEGGSWTVSVYGADHPGIVHGVAALLAGLGVNIVDLSTRMVGSAEAPVYAMVLEVTLPPEADPGEVGRRLEATAGELGVTCRLHPSEADIL
jgi:glycine cleavage system transcriptional repressor